MLNVYQDTITLVKSVQFVHVFRDIPEIHWAIVHVVNVKVIQNVGILVLVSTIHVLIHALDNVEQMLFANREDTQPFAVVQMAILVMPLFRVVNREAFQ